ncbi:MAG TPA: DUF4158 domain-containing protein [Acidimicrobiales bacterium]|nr:DUF4158 domain-containing protein [Acidimicrobiales bacterium]
MTVRFLGTFLADPPEVPWPVVVFVAGQLGIADPSCVKDYGSRPMTAHEHQWDIIALIGPGVLARWAGGLGATSWTFPGARWGGLIQSRGGRTSLSGVFLGREGSVGDFGGVVGDRVCWFGCGRPGGLGCRSGSSGGVAVGVGFGHFVYQFDSVLIFDGS